MSRPRIPALQPRIPMLLNTRIPQSQIAQRHGTARRVTGRTLQETRKRIWLRDGARCRMCQELVSIEPGTDRPCEIDHIVPLWAGGAESDDANLQCLCPPCHALKTDQEAAERALVDGRRGAVWRRDD